MNVAPLQLAPLYSATKESGLVDDGLEREWAGSPENLTRVAGRLGEEVGLVNRIWELEMGGVKRKGEKGRGLEEGKFAVMDIYGLVSFSLFFFLSTSSISIAYLPTYLPISKVIISTKHNKPPDLRHLS